MMVKVNAELASLLKSAPQVTVQDFVPGADLYASSKMLSVAEAIAARGRIARLEAHLANTPMTDRQRNAAKNQVVALRLRLKNVCLTDAEADGLIKRGQSLCEAMKSPHMDLDSRVAMLVEVRQILVDLATRRLPDVRQTDPVDARKAKRQLPAAAHLADVAFAEGAGAAALAAVNGKAKLAEKQELMSV